VTGGAAEGEAERTMRGTGRPDEHAADAGTAGGRIGSMNHLRLTVTDIPRAEQFYDPLLGFMGYRLVEKSGIRLAWAAMTPGGSRRRCDLVVCCGRQADVAPSAIGVIVTGDFLS